MTSGTSEPVTLNRYDTLLTPLELQFAAAPSEMWTRAGLAFWRRNSSPFFRRMTTTNYCRVETTHSLPQLLGK